MGVRRYGEQGEYAPRPLAIPLRGWRSVLARVLTSLSEDNLSIVAAGVAFYGLLAIFPAIAAFVMIYGLAMDPGAVERQIAPLRTLVPEDAYNILATQLHAVASLTSIRCRAETFAGAGIHLEKSKYQVAPML